MELAKPESVKERQCSHLRSFKVMNHLVLPETDGSSLDAEVSVLKPGQSQASYPGLPGAEGQTQIRGLLTLKAGKVAGQTGRSQSPYNTKSRSARGDIKFRIGGAKMRMLWARV